jgi:hypothetical protein
MEAYTNGYIRSEKYINVRGNNMGDSLFTFFVGAAVTAILLVLSWSMSACAIGENCDKLGSFYLGDKVYKCEVKK